MKIGRGSIEARHRIERKIAGFVVVVCVSTFFAIFFVPLISSILFLTSIKNNIDKIKITHLHFKENSEISVGIKCDGIKAPFNMGAKGIKVGFGASRNEEPFAYISSECIELKRGEELNINVLLKYHLPVRKKITPESFLMQTENNLLFTFKGAVYFKAGKFLPSMGISLMIPYTLAVFIGNMHPSNEKLIDRFKVLRSRAVGQEASPTKRPLPMTIESYAMSQTETALDISGRFNYTRLPSYVTCTVPSIAMKICVSNGEACQVIVGEHQIQEGVALAAVPFALSGTRASVLYAKQKVADFFQKELIEIAFTNIEVGTPTASGSGGLASRGDGGTEPILGLDLVSEFITQAAGILKLKYLSSPGPPMPILDAPLLNIEILKTLDTGIYARFVFNEELLPFADMAKAINATTSLPSFDMVLHINEECVATLHGKHVLLPRTSPNAKCFAFEGLGVFAESLSSLRDVIGKEQVGYNDKNSLLKKVELVVHDSPMLGQKLLSGFGVRWREAEGVSVGFEWLLPQPSTAPPQEIIGHYTLEVDLTDKPPFGVFSYLGAYLGQVKVLFQKNARPMNYIRVQWPDLSLTLHSDNQLLSGRLAPSEFAAFVSPDSNIWSLQSGKGVAGHLFIETLRTSTRSRGAYITSLQTLHSPAYKLVTPIKLGFSKGLAKEARATNRRAAAPPSPNTPKALASAVLYTALAFGELKMAPDACLVSGSLTERQGMHSIIPSTANTANSENSEKTDLSRTHSFTYLLKTAPEACPSNSSSFTLVVKAESLGGVAVSEGSSLGYVYTTPIIVSLHAADFRLLQIFATSDGVHPIGITPKFHSQLVHYIEQLACAPLNDNLYPLSLGLSSLFKVIRTEIAVMRSGSEWVRSGQPTLTFEHRIGARLPDSATLPRLEVQGKIEEQNSAVLSGCVKVRYGCTENLVFPYLRFNERMFRLPSFFFQVNTDDHNGSLEMSKVVVEELGAVTGKDFGAGLTLSFTIHQAALVGLREKPDNNSQLEIGMVTASASKTLMIFPSAFARKPKPPTPAFPTVTPAPPKPRLNLTISLKEIEGRVVGPNTPEKTRGHVLTQGGVFSKYTSQSTQNLYKQSLCRNTQPFSTMSVPELTRAFASKKSAPEKKPGPITITIPNLIPSLIPNLISRGKTSTKIQTASSAADLHFSELLFTAVVQGGALEELGEAVVRKIEKLLGVPRLLVVADVSIEGISVLTATNDKNNVAPIFISLPAVRYTILAPSATVPLLHKAVVRASVIAPQHICVPNTAPYSKLELSPLAQLVLLFTPYGDSVAPRTNLSTGIPKITKAAASYLSGVTSTITEYLGSFVVTTPLGTIPVSPLSTIATTPKKNVLAIGSFETGVIKEISVEKPVFIVVEHREKTLLVIPLSISVGREDKSVLVVSGWASGAFVDNGIHIAKVVSGEMTAFLVVDNKRVFALTLNKGAVRAFLGFTNTNYYLGVLGSFFIDWIPGSHLYIKRCIKTLLTTEVPKSFLNDPGVVAREDQAAKNIYTLEEHLDQDHRRP
ncbi:hypothetical protein NEDG_01262 [Nematocida displodere]|uniref:Transmembrane protein n=1 Tax=Nematocida displodere TaxID=1805483 RepID=A0A177EDX0_9MICR|nr:hypothetical protein NEDG_01262 [Nematocida displodere]